MYSPITIDALRVLDAIERTQSFAAAAEELHRVPSAVSYTINKLEEELGVSIFDRSRRKAVLTAVGKLMLEQGRQRLAATEELTAMSRQVASGWEVELKIGIDSVLDPGPIYQLIREFQREQPRIEIRLSEEVLGGSWDALTTERCDLVIGATGEPPSSGYRHHVLGHVMFEFAVAFEHPLAHGTESISAQQIKRYSTVIVADSSRYLPVRSSGLLDGRSRVVVSSIERKIEAQKLGLGIGFLPLHRIQDELISGSLAVVNIDEPRAPQDISVAWRGRRKGKALRWFIDRLKMMRFDTVKGLVSLD